MTYKPLTTLADLWENEMRGYVVDSTRILVVRLPGTVRAFENRCAHLGLPLSDGSLEDNVITCRAHHYKYDARTGCGINPKSVALRSFPVRIVDGVISVDTQGENP